MSDIEKLREELSQAQDELLQVEKERDDALAELQKVEWQLHAVEKNAQSEVLLPTNVKESDLNLELQFQEERIKDLELREAAITKKEVELKNLDVDRINYEEKLTAIQLSFEIEKSKLSDEIISLRQEERIKDLELREAAITKKEVELKNLDVDRINYEEKLTAIQLSFEIEKSKLSDEIISLRNELLSKITEFEQSQKESCNEIEKQKSTFLELLKEHTDEITALKSVLQTLKAEKSNLEIRLETITLEQSNHLQSRDSKIANLEVELQKIKESEARLRRDNEEMSKASNDDKSFLAEASKQIKQLSFQLSSLEEDLKKKYLDQISSAEKKLQELEKTSAEKYKTLESTTTSKASSLEAQIAKLKAEINESKNEVNTLKSSLQSSESDVQSYQQKYDKVNQQLIQLQATTAENQKKTKELEALSATLQERELAVCKREEVSRRTTEGLERKVSTLKASKETLQAKADAAEARATQAETNIATLEKFLAKANKEVSRLTKKLDDLMSKQSGEKETTGSAGTKDIGTPSGASIEKTSTASTSVESTRTRSERAKSVGGGDKGVGMSKSSMLSELSSERKLKWCSIGLNVILLFFLFATLSYNVMSSTGGTNGPRGTS